ncbi:MAG: DUF1501 domain-containing protein [Fuerstiella sp.]|nr:DUF1501 domain-containing protein [Fuerstiella sp.]MCP4506762.1 DUF1501 domain-containing protein [Fuerstiella sp.]
MNLDRAMQRRSFLGVGIAGGLTVRVSSLAEAASAGRKAQAKNVLVILEQGGLSHLDTWDPKPDVVTEHRSPFGPVSTAVPGLQFTSLLSKTARVADRLTVIRSMFHDRAGANGHPLGTQYALSGELPGGPLEMPDIGSIVSQKMGTECDYLPPYIMVPGNHEQAKQTRLGFLPASAKVFKTGGRDLSDPNWRVNDLGLLTGVDRGRFRDRRDLLSNLNVGVAPGESGPVRTLSDLADQAANLLTNPQTQRAFNLAEEADATRDQYGRGHRGQCYLLGRRLIERGVRFVTVDVREPLTDKTPGGFNMNWDHHDYIYNKGSCGTIRNAAGGEGRYGIGHWVMMGSTDQAFAALITDLDDRGLLDETLVAFVTEFGRTPRLNRFQGRDHWTNAYSIALAGAGVPGGQVVGSSDAEGGYVTNRPLRPDDYAATIYEKLGLDRSQPVYTPSNRPVFLAHKGKAIDEVF